MDLAAKLSLNKPIKPLQILIAVIPFFTGIFHEWQSAILALALLGILIFEALKNKKLEIDYGLPLLFAALVVGLHALSGIWAVDKGMVWLGVVKFLPLPLFVLAASRKEDLLRFVPLSGAVMTIVSICLSPIEALKGHITVSGRLGGFFEYPNAFAMFLLACLILVLFKEKINLTDWIFAVIYLAGIALSGSRTVFALTALTAIVFIITVKDKKIKLISIAVLAAGAVLAGFYVSRKLSSLSNMSTFYGRFLYFADALPVILKHPLGLGYYGYYYSQGSFQTGVYSVIHIHNDLLQIFLDIGWAPAILAIVMVVKAFYKADFRNKVLLAMLTLHLLFDFDMQFISMAVLYLTVVINSSKTKTKELPSNKVLIPLAVATPVIAVFSLIFGMASFFNYTRNYEQAVKFYPNYTEVQKSLLFTSQSNEEMNAIADKLIKNNPNLSIANDAKARVAFSNGDIVSMMTYKETAIKNNKYDLSEYLDYIDMLSYAISLYAGSGDMDSAEYCMDRCIRLEADLRAVEAGTSDLGWKIDDKPDLTLPAEYSEYITLLQNAKSA
ncbi:MAG: O-antigen ligase family protein [Oscillospiraceae bacterium]|nr:O-antigen ligase family protein [Oscillospiraceae bacterium]